MKITLRLFAVLRETTGHSTIHIEVDPGTTASRAFQQAPAMEHWHGRVAFAREDEMLASDTPLQDGDVLDCLPPVSGG